MAVLAPDGVPDPWLTFLAEGTGAIPLVGLAVLVVLLYGRDRLANRRVPGSEVLGLDPETDSTIQSSNTTTSE
ncbi:hypothetical protein [Halorientalis pallida]|uniref:Uncharacterized protein n=1 Tax=Halorientalis pallida TaxID=2479928 RepID=A0A498KW99_9EURY|nr:hypothetical protein [Halorientalis pallida]RXK46753.1 hypothetical protein EAF64_18965 [Halorientalis pallida]